MHGPRTCSLNKLVGYKFRVPWHADVSIGITSIHIFKKPPSYIPKFVIDRKHVSSSRLHVSTVDSTVSDDNEWVEVGIVGPPHGVRGEFKVQPLTDFPEERLGEPGPRWLQAPIPKIGRSEQQLPEQVELQWGRTSIFKGREVWIVKLGDIDSPEEASLIRNHVILIPASAREPLDDEDEFYVQQLIGLRVILDDTNEDVGKVVDLFDGTGTHDVLRIELTPEFINAQLKEKSTKLAEQEETISDEASKNIGTRRKIQAMMPFAKELVPVVDINGGFMRITPPAGLLELAVEVPVVKQRRKENAGQRERRRRPRNASNSNNNTNPTMSGDVDITTKVQDTRAENSDRGL